VPRRPLGCYRQPRGDRAAHRHEPRGTEVRARGERTFVTAFGAGATLTPEAVDALDLGPEDLVHVSSYRLLKRSNGATLGPWLACLSRDPLVLLDPRPLVRDIPTVIWAAALDRADWRSCGARGARLLTGESDDRLAAHALRALVPNLVVRRGPGARTLAPSLRRSRRKPLCCDRCKVPTLTEMHSFGLAPDAAG